MCMERKHFNFSVLSHLPKVKALQMLASSRADALETGQS